MKIDKEEKCRKCKRVLTPLEKMRYQYFCENCSIKPDLVDLLKPKDVLPKY